MPQGKSLTLLRSTTPRTKMEKRMMGAIMISKKRASRAYYIRLRGHQGKDKSRKPQKWNHIRSKWNRRITKRERSLRRKVSLIICKWIKPLKQCIHPLFKNRRVLLKVELCSTTISKSKMKIEIRASRQLQRSMEIKISLKRIMEATTTSLRINQTTMIWAINISSLMSTLSSSSKWCMRMYTPLFTIISSFQAHTTWCTLITNTLITHLFQRDIFSILLMSTPRLIEWHPVME